jgi:hypothetical protein
MHETLLSVVAEADLYQPFTMQYSLKDRKTSWSVLS